MNYHWPGNVRELRTAVEHGLVLSKGEKVTLRDLPASVRAGGKSTADGPSKAMLDGETLTVEEAEKTIDHARLERNSREQDFGGAENWHKSADLASQTAQLPPRGILILCQVCRNGSTSTRVPMRINRVPRLFELWIHSCRLGIRLKSLEVVAVQFAMQGPPTYANSLRRQSPVP